MIRIVCLKWGQKYPAQYVNRLYGMVSRHLHRPFTFHCLTENPDGLSPGINILALPDFGLQGWWYKLLFFKPGFLPFSSDDLVVYLDLDVVILNDLNGLIEEFKGDYVLCISADDQPDRMNSSVMVFRPDTLDFVWTSFWAQRTSITKNFHGDQDWIERVVPSARILSKSVASSFKLDLNSKTPYSFGSLGRWLRKRFWALLAPRGQVPTPDCAIVLFHGRPNPDDVMEGPWDKYRHAPWAKGEFKLDIDPFLLSRLENAPTAEGGEKCGLGYSEDKNTPHPRSTGSR